MPPKKNQKASTGRGRKRQNSVDNNEDAEQTPPLPRMPSLSRVEDSLTQSIANNIQGQIRQVVRQELAALLATPGPEVAGPSINGHPLHPNQARTMTNIPGAAPAVVVDDSLAQDTPEATMDDVARHPADVQLPDGVVIKVAVPALGSAQQGHGSSIVRGSGHESVPLPTLSAPITNRPVSQGTGHESVLPAPLSGPQGAGHESVPLLPATAATGVGHVSASMSAATQGSSSLQVPISASKLQESISFSGGVGELAPASAPLPLDYSVTPEIKAKIWSNEYFELGDLLHPSQSGQLNLVLKQGEKGEVAFQQKNKKQPKTINEWLSAFAVFSAVYGQKFPGEVGALLKYSENVRMVAANKGNFNFYDSNFRKLRQHTVVPWGLFHSELYMKSLQPTAWYDANGDKGQNQAENLPPSTGSTSRVPVGFCFRFHSNRSCDTARCPYRHKCFVCHGFHPINRCWQRSNSGMRSVFQFGNGARGTARGNGNGLTRGRGAGRQHQGYQSTRSNTN